MRETPPAPSHLDDTAAQYWNEFWPIADDTITHAHAHLVERYCVAYAIWVQTSQTINRAGLLARGPKNSIRVNPLIAVRDRATAAMMALEPLLGLLPKLKPASNNGTRGNCATR